MEAGRSRIRAPGVATNDADTVPEFVEREFYPARWSAPGNVGLSLGLGALSAYAASVLLGGGEMIGVAFAGLAAWMGWSAVGWLRRWRDPQPAIALSREGILDGTGLMTPRFIPWSEIESVSMDDRSTTLVLRENTAVRIPLHRRVLGWLARKSRREYVLPTRTLDTPHPMIGSSIEQCHESLLLQEVRSAKALGESQ